MAPNASKEPASDRVIAAFVQLASSSKDLNDEIAQWTKHISVLNEALRKLKIGVSAWHTISSGGDEPEWNSREIGYAKIEDEWQIALRKRWGHMNFPEDDGEEIWPFEDAPRWFMLDAGGKIPDLLETLVKRTNETIAKVTKRKNETAELALRLSALANGIPEATKEGK